MVLFLAQDKIMKKLFYFEIIHPRKMQFLHLNFFQTLLFGICLCALATSHLVNGQGGRPEITQVDIRQLLKDNPGLIKVAQENAAKAQKKQEPKTPAAREPKVAEATQAKKAPEPAATQKTPAAKTPNRQRPTRPRHRLAVRRQQQASASEPQESKPTQNARTFPGRE